MTCLKILLSSVLVLCLATILFAGSASAAGGTTLCKSNETPCSTLNHYGLGAEFRATSSAITLIRTTSPFNEQIKCGKSEIKGKQVSTGSNTTNVEVQVTLIAFFECLKQPGGEGCTNIALNQPEAAIANTAGTMNGTLSIGEFSLTSVCKFSPDCIFTSSSISLEMTGGEPASLVANGEELAGPGTGCPKALDWTATYTFTEPTALWLAQSL